MKHWPIILGTTFVFTAFDFLKTSPDLSWLVKTTFNHQIYMYICQTTVYELHCARKIPVGLNRRHVLVSSFIQLTSIIWVLCRCQALFQSRGDSDAGSRHGSCHPCSQTRGGGGQDCTAIGISLGMVMCMGKSIWVFSLCGVNMRAGLPLCLQVWAPNRSEEDLRSQKARGAWFFVCPSWS